MGKISIEQAAFLKTVASLAYGSGSSEKTHGGKGHMALLNENGKVRVIKCNTHFSHADKVQNEIRNANQLPALRKSLLEGSKLLSQSLLEIGETLGLSDEALKEVRDCAENGGKTLLTRQMVAKFVTEAQRQENSGDQAGVRLLDRIWDEAQTNAVKSDLSMTFEKVTGKNATDFHGTINVGQLTETVADLNQLNQNLGLSGGDLFPDDKDNPVRALVGKLQSGRPQSPEDEALMRNALQLSVGKQAQHFDNGALNNLLRDACRTCGIEPTAEELSAFRKSGALKETVVGMLRGTKTKDDLSILVNKTACDVLARVLQEKNILRVCNTLVNTLKTNGMTETARTLGDLTKALATEGSIDNYKALKTFLGKLNAAGLCVAQLAQDIGAGKAGRSFQTVIEACIKDISGLSSADTNFFMNAVHKEIDNALARGEYDHEQYCEKLKADLRLGGEKAGLILNRLHENDKAYMAEIKGFTGVAQMLTKGGQHISQVIEEDKFDREVKGPDGSVYKRTDVTGGRSFGKEYEKHADQSCLFHSVLKGLGYDVSRENGLILRQTLNNFIADCLSKIKGYEQGKTFKPEAQVSDFIKKFSPNYDSHGAVGPGTKLAIQFSNDGAFDITSPSTMMEDGVIPFLATMLNRPIELIEVDGNNEVTYSAKFDFNVMTGEKLNTSEPVVRIMHKGAHFQSLELIESADQKPQPVLQNNGSVKEAPKMTEKAAPKMTGKVVQKRNNPPTKNVDAAQMEKLEALAKDTKAKLTTKLDKIVQEAFSRENLQQFSDFIKDWTKNGWDKEHKRMSLDQKTKLAKAITAITRSIEAGLKQEFGTFGNISDSLAPIFNAKRSKEVVGSRDQVVAEFRDHLLKSIRSAMEDTISGNTARSSANVIKQTIQLLHDTDENFDSDRWSPTKDNEGFWGLAKIDPAVFGSTENLKEDELMNYIAREAFGAFIRLGW